MPATSAAAADPPPPDVPRHVADLSDVQRCADSKKDDLMDRTDANIRSWIAFRFSFYMALITRCNVWTQLNTLSPFTDASDSAPLRARQSCDTVPRGCRPVGYHVVSDPVLFF